MYNVNDYLLLEGYIVFYNHPPYLVLFHYINNTLSEYLISDGELMYSDDVCPELKLKSIQKAIIDYRMEKEDKIRENTK